MEKKNKHEKLLQEELNRYARHFMLPEVGLEGQLKLKNARVLVVGTGGLGSPIIMYLAAVGVGTIGIVDFDRVDESNLQRQIIHATKDVGDPKVFSAAAKVEAINPNVKIIPYNDRLTSRNALEIIKDFDIVVDGTDNFQTRYLINDSCVILNKPYVYGSIFRFEGQVSVFNAYNGPCYRCLYPESPPPFLVPTCAEAGVIGVLPGIVGTIQANETIKLILEIGQTLSGKLLALDALRMQFKELKLKKDENCPVCGNHPSIKGLIDYEEFCGVEKFLDERADDIVLIEEISKIKLKNLMDEKSSIQLIDIRPAQDFNMVNIEGSINIPYDELLKRLDELDSSKKIIIVCKIGFLSKEAIKKLIRIGFQGSIKSLSGGMTSWLNDTYLN